MKKIAIIPAYNEQLTIGSIITLTRKYVDEILVIDDGSNDMTSIIAKELGCGIIKFENNKGKGIALTKGFEKAIQNGGDIIITLDGDGEHNPKDIPNLLDPVINGECDVSIGVRYNDGRGKTPRVRRIGQQVLDAQTSIIAKHQFTDSQSGFRCFSRKAIEDIKANIKGYEAESLILIEAIKKGFRIKEVPIDAEYRKKSSIVQPISQGFGILLSLINVIGKEHILLSFGSLSILSFIISLFLGLRTFFLFNEYSEWPMGTIITTAIFFLIGIYLSTTGLTLFVMQESKFKTERMLVNMKIK